LVKFLAKNTFKYQVLPDSSIIILSQFGTPDKEGNINISFPMHYVLDREGKVAAKAQGIKGIEAVKGELRNGFLQKRLINGNSLVAHNSVIGYILNSPSRAER